MATLGSIIWILQLALSLNNFAAMAFGYINPMEAKTNTLVQLLISYKTPINKNCRS